MNELEATISQVIDENNISSEWNEGLLNELKHINLDLNSKRKDLTAAPFITIDGKMQKILMTRSIVSLTSHPSS